MNIDIDSLLNASDGWSLTLSIDGRPIIVSPPPSASCALLEKILSRDSVTEADRPELTKLIVPLVNDPAVDVTGWRFGQLVGAATAIVIRAREEYIANSRGICRAVALAMRTPRSPNAAAATVPDAAGSDQAAANAAAPALDPAARKTLEDFIKLRSGVAVPPGTSDADLDALVNSAGASAMRPMQPGAAIPEPKA